MLLSKKHKFIFVHIDKAAGTSVQAALAPFAIPASRSRLRRRIADLGPIAKLPFLCDLVEFGVHSSAVKIRRALPASIWNHSFKFAFVRNPWDRLVSRYQFLRRSSTNRNHAKVMCMEFPVFAREEMRRNRPHLRQVNYLCDHRATVLVDYIGRFETLNNDFSEICRRIGVTCELPHLNSTTRKDYRAYYDEALRNEVGEHFASDCNMFGYNFEGIVTR